jgi:hypothetical protein
VSRVDDIAAALAVVPGIDAKPYQPNTVHPGECWPARVRTTPLTGCALEQTYQVHVVLPGGAPETTARAYDDLLRPMTDALVELGAYVDWFEPTAMLGQDGGGTIPLLSATIRITD